MNDARVAASPISYIVLVAFMACVPVSNWMITYVGIECVEDGPCLIPVFPGIWAPSGVLLAGAALMLRDVVQERLGLRWAVLAIAAGGLLSAMVSSPALALASVCSYVVAELVDLHLFTSMRRRGFLRAAFVSSLVGLILDSVVFVYLAFGQLDHVDGQIVGKLWAVLSILPFLTLWRRVGTW